jgi:peptidoglycan hydrolase-like protein with peptidoglycan-binding domain
MKSFITKVLIIAGLISLVPFFSYAATLECSTSYPGDLISKEVIFTATLNGEGNFVYSWEGASPTSDPMIATNSYSETGTKNITVTASSTDTSDYLTADCEVNIYNAGLPVGDAWAPSVTATCEANKDIAAINDPIRWSLSSFSGSLGNEYDYSIEWSGTDLLSDFNTNIVIRYASSSEKLMSIKSIKSRYSETEAHDINIPIQCDGSVEVVPEKYRTNEDLAVSGTCSPSENTSYVNDSVIWNSFLTIRGAVEDNQKIQWFDSVDDSEMGTGSSTNKVYTSTGSKGAFVRVTDGSRISQDIVCSVVEISNRSNGGSSHNNNDSDETATSTASTTPSTATSTPNGTDGDNNEGGDNDDSDNDANGNGIDDSLEGDDEDNGGYNLYEDYLFTEDQNPGTYSEDVANLQSRLTEEGFYNGLIGGFFGPATEQALRDYQLANGLPETGILDAATRAFLNNRFDLGVSSTTDKDGEVSSKISGLTATIFDAFGSAIDFVGGKINIALITILTLLVIGQLYLWLKISKKKE